MSRPGATFARFSFSAVILVLDTFRLSFLDELFLTQKGDDKSILYKGPNSANSKTKQGTQARAVPVGPTCETIAPLLTVSQREATEEAEVCCHSVETTAITHADPRSKNVVGVLRNLETDTGSPELSFME